MSAATRANQDEGKEWKIEDGAEWGGGDAYIPMLRMLVVFMTSLFGSLTDSQLHD